jgi:hypothetical protein
MDPLLFSRIGAKGGGVSANTTNHYQLTTI